MGRTWVVTTIFRNMQTRIHSHNDVESRRIANEENVRVIYPTQVPDACTITVRDIFLEKGKNLG